MGSIPDADQRPVSLRLRHASRRRDHGRAGVQCRPRDLEGFEIEAVIVHTRMSRGLSIAIAVASIVVITFVFRMVAGIAPISIVNVTTVGFAYLIAVLLIAARWGITESVIASLAA